jgi:hypothetical protein
MGMLYLCTIVPAGRKASESTSVINYSNNNDYASYSQEKAVPQRSMACGTAVVI